MVRSRLLVWLQGRKLNAAGRRQARALMQASPEGQAAHSLYAFYPMPCITHLVNGPAVCGAAVVVEQRLGRVFDQSDAHLQGRGIRGGG